MQEEKPQHPVFRAAVLVPAALSILASALIGVSLAYGASLRADVVEVRAEQRAEIEKRGEIKATLLIMQRDIADIKAAVAGKGKDDGNPGQ